MLMQASILCYRQSMVTRYALARMTTILQYGQVFSYTRANMSPPGLFCVGLFREMGEHGKKAEHAEAEAKKHKGLERRFAEAQTSSSHSYVVQVCGTFLMGHLQQFFWSLKPSFHDGK